MPGIIEEVNHPDLILPILRCASTILTGGLPYTPARPLPIRRLWFSDVYTSFFLLIGQFAVVAAKMEYSWARAVGTSALTFAFEAARPTLIRNKNWFSVTETLLHLVFWVTYELESYRRVMYAWRTFRSRESRFLDVC